MADSIRNRVANALAWTTDQIEPGRGKSQVSLHSMYLDDIQKRTRHVQVANFVPFYVLRVLYVEADPGGEQVNVLDKTRKGILILLDGAYAVARDYGFARTIVEDFSLDGGHAEPVTAFVKGKQYAAFRMVGQERNLYVLDPAITGGPGKQFAMRDRIVCRANGEMQAGPKFSDTSGPMWNSLIRLVDASDTFEDPRSPRVDSQGQIQLSEGEVVVYQDQHSIEIIRNEQTAYGGGSWKAMTSPSSPAHVVLTDRRLVVSWPNWAADPTSGVMAQRRARAGFPDAISNQSLVAGQFSWAWVSSVFKNDQPDVGGPTALELQANDRVPLVRFRILDLSAELSARLQREVSRAIADHRLHHRDSIEAADRATLEAIQRGEPKIEHLDWGDKIGLPAAYRIAMDPQP